jgi:hypothetical protein
MSAMAMMFGDVLAVTPLPVEGAAGAVVGVRPAADVALAAGVFPGAGVAVLPADAAVTTIFPTIASFAWT